jgi:hypothetical protein
MMRSLSSPRPILYPQHGWARRVLDLDPRLAPAGTVGQVPPLRDDAFKPELAGVLENGRAIAVEMLREANPVAVREQLSELALAQFKRRGPQIFAVQLDQVEGIEEDARVIRARMQSIEI